MFHAMRSFRREITADIVGITMAERLLVLETLQKMAYVKSPEKYDGLYHDLLENNMKSVVE